MVGGYYGRSKSSVVVVGMLKIFERLWLMIVGGILMVDGEDDWDV